MRRPPHFDSPEQEVYLNLWRTYDRLRAEEDALFGDFGLTAQQYNALRILRGEHPASLPTLALAARLVSRAPDITRLVDKLVQRGWVERRRPPGNRRVVELQITAEGLKLLRELDEPVRRCHQRQLGHLSPQQLRDLTSLLKEARRPHEADAGPWSDHTSR
ncbi:MAG: MarR family transcriptional regulator [Planctomycetes bacterium]|nr:MarR family transcriptional regulator [Planctomycetota bacterium]